MSHKAVEISKLSFEQALQELDTLVKKLEEGRLPLEEAIASYERGTGLKNHCEAKLREAKLRVDQMTIGTDGTATLTPFDEEPAA